jgi:hypothetical protein
MIQAPSTLPSPAAVGADFALLRSFGPPLSKVRSAHGFDEPRPLRCQLAPLGLASQEPCRKLRRVGMMELAEEALNGAPAIP